MLASNVHSYFAVAIPPLSRSGIQCLQPQFCDMHVSTIRLSRVLISSLPEQDTLSVVSFLSKHSFAAWLADANAGVYRWCPVTVLIESHSASHAFALVQVITLRPWWLSCKCFCLAILYMMSQVNLSHDDRASALRHGA